MKQEKNCLFCKIASKEIKSNIVFENDKIVAFTDINPQAPVHILIVPREHIPGLNDIEDSHKLLLGEIQLVAKELARRNNLTEEGYRVVANCGPNAGQAVAHIHYHFLGGRVFGWPPG